MDREVMKIDSKLLTSLVLDKSDNFQIIKTFPIFGKNGQRANKSKYRASYFDDLWRTRAGTHAEVKMLHYCIENL
eukprot:9202765-Ditylum_brightwellii.AAC.1